MKSKSFEFQNNSHESCTRNLDAEHSTSIVPTTSVINVNHNRRFFISLYPTIGRIKICFCPSKPGFKNSHEENVISELLRATSHCCLSRILPRSLCLEKNTSEDCNKFQFVYHEKAAAYLSMFSFIFPHPVRYHPE